MSQQIRIALLIASLSTRLASHPAWGIATDADGRIIFSDVGMNAIWRIESSGKLERLASGLHSHDLWQEPGTGVLYGVHAYFIEAEQRFAFDKWRLRPGHAVERIAELPKHFNVLTAADGSQYFSDGAKVSRRSASGATEAVGGQEFMSLPRRADSLNGIAISKDGSLYIADSQYHCVWKVAASGGIAERAHESGSWWTPTGVTVRGADLFVLEDRPHGWKAALAFWEAPRVLRIRGGEEPHVVMVIDFYRERVILLGLALVGAVLVLFRVTAKRLAARAKGTTPA